MSSIKAVVVEMLSIFELKGKSGAKQIKDHLHTAWPVPDSRSQLEKLKSELKEEMAKSFEVVSELPYLSLSLSIYLYLSLSISLSLSSFSDTCQCSE